MIIKTRIYGFWLEFLQTEVKPTLTGISDFMIDYGQKSGVGTINVIVDDDDRYVTLSAIMGSDVDQEFDLALRRYVVSKWGHRL